MNIEASLYLKSLYLHGSGSNIFKCTYVLSESKGEVKVDNGDKLIL